MKKLIVISLLESCLDFFLEIVEFFSVIFNLKNLVNKEQFFFRKLIQILSVFESLEILKGDFLVRSTNI